jgi:hypothetical protein
MTVIGALSSFRKRREMSPHKRLRPPMAASGRIVGDSYKGTSELAR